MNIAVWVVGQGGKSSSLCPPHFQAKGLWSGKEFASISVAANEALLMDKAQNESNVTISLIGHHGEFIRQAWWETTNHSQSGYGDVVGTGGRGQLRTFDYAAVVQCRCQRWGLGGWMQDELQVGQTLSLHFS